MWSKINFCHCAALHQNVFAARIIKKRETVLYSLFLVSFWQCVAYNWESGNTPWTWTFSVCGASEACLLHQLLENVPQAEHIYTCLTAVLHYGHFSASSSSTCVCPLRVQRDRCPDPNFWNQCLAIRKLTALSQNVWRIQRLFRSRTNPLKLVKQAYLEWAPITHPFLFITAKAISTASVRCDAHLLANVNNTTLPLAANPHMLHLFPWYKSLLSMWHQKRQKLF